VLLDQLKEISVFIQLEDGRNVEKERTEMGELGIAIND
jgi:hypothetical protein